MFDLQREHLLRAIDAAHDEYYKSEVFTGPSLYFHQQALRAAETGDLHMFAVMAYAVLAAWGMHRMGRGGSKMCNFEDFERSLERHWPQVRRLRKLAPTELDDGGWQDLRELFCGICCMKTSISLVGNSKVMAHALPNLIPPVDREYTLNFLYGSGAIKNGKDGEWERLEEMLRNFFYPVLQTDLFQSKALAWIGETSRFVWDTSHLKIVDNLIIGYMRLIPDDPTARAALLKAYKLPPARFGDEIHFVKVSG